MKQSKQNSVPRTTAIFFVCATASNRSSRNVKTSFNIFYRISKEHRYIYRFIEERSCKMDTITLRISVIGEIAVGKTSLISRFADGTFTYLTNPTMHDKTVIQLQVEADTIKLIITDNCGVEGFHQMVRSFNSRADCLIFVYDVTRKHSLESMDRWLEVIGKVCDEKIPLIIVGNKMDLPYREREVSTQDVLNYVQGKKAICFETSAKDDYNIKKVFYEAVTQTLKSHSLLVPGCEEDLFIRHLNSKTNIVPEPPERSLKKVLVNQAIDSSKIAVTTIQPQFKKKDSGCC